MMVEYKAELKNIDRGKARINVRSKLDDVYKPLLGPIFEAILHAMKNTDKRAFYNAMAIFAENDFDDAMEFLTGCEDD